MAVVALTNLNSNSNSKKAMEARRTVVRWTELVTVDVYKYGVQVGHIACHLGLGNELQLTCCIRAPLHSPRRSITFMEPHLPPTEHSIHRRGRYPLDTAGGPRFYFPSLRTQLINHLSHGCGEYPLDTVCDSRFVESYVVRFTPSKNRQPDPSPNPCFTSDSGGSRPSFTDRQSCSDIQSFPLVSL